MTMITEAEPQTGSTSAQLSKIAAHAYRIRRFALRMGEVQGQGYIGQALGLADALAVAWCHAMNIRPAEPEWEGRDRFLLSHGHYAIALYAALIEARSVRSHFRAIACPPVSFISRARSSTVSRLRAAIATFAPSRAAILAVADPI